MRSEVPDDVDVVLKEAEIDPHRIKIVNITEPARRDDLLHLADGSRIDERVIDEEFKVLLFGDLDKFFRFGRAGGHRLLDKAMLSCLKCGLCDSVVCRNGGCDDNDIDIVAGDDRVVISRCLDAMKHLPHLCEPAFVEVARYNAVDLVSRKKISDKVWAPVTGSDNSSFH